MQEISAELPEPSIDQFGYVTPEVTNQPRPLTDYDAFGTDEVLNCPNLRCRELPESPPRGRYRGRFKPGPGVGAPGKP
jgi:hypothetical protein